MNTRIFRTLLLSLLAVLALLPDAALGYTSPGLTSEVGGETSFEETVLPPLPPKEAQELLANPEKAKDPSLKRVFYRNGEIVEIEQNERTIAVTTVNTPLRPAIRKPVSSSSSVGSMASAVSSAASSASSSSEEVHEAASAKNESMLGTLILLGFGAVVIITSLLVGGLGFYILRFGNTNGATIPAPQAIAQASTSDIPAETPTQPESPAPASGPTLPMAVIALLAGGLAMVGTHQLAIRAEMAFFPPAVIEEGVTLRADVDNFFFCTGEGSFPLGDETLLNDPSVRFWIYEYTGKEPPFDGRYLLSQVEQMTHPELLSNGIIDTFAYNTIYYIQSEKDLAVQCGRGLSIPVTCGDGVVGLSESCDDANMQDGDGCNATCAIEDGYRCGGTPNTCLETAAPAPVVIPVVEIAPAPSFAEEDICVTHPDWCTGVKIMQPVVELPTACPVYGFKPGCTLDCAPGMLGSCPACAYKCAPAPATIKPECTSDAQCGGVQCSNCNKKLNGQCTQVCSIAQCANGRCALREEERSCESPSCMPAKAAPQCVTNADCGTVKCSGCASNPDGSCSRGCMNPICNAGKCIEMLEESICNAQQCPETFNKLPTPDPKPSTPIATFCGNGVCDAGESDSCFGDCMQTRPVDACGDGVCNESIGESNVSCPTDCRVAKGTPTPCSSNGDFHSCFDTDCAGDSSKNLYQKGTATYNQGSDIKTVTDFCAGSGVFEMICTPEGKVEGSWTECPRGACENGVCIR